MGDSKICHLCSHQTELLWVSGQDGLLHAKPQLYFSPFRDNDDYYRVRN